MWPSGNFEAFRQILEQTEGRLCGASPEIVSQVVRRPRDAFEYFFSLKDSGINGFIPAAAADSAAVDAIPRLQRAGHDQRCFARSVFRASADRCKKSPTVILGQLGFIRKDLFCENPQGS